LPSSGHSTSLDQRGTSAVLLLSAMKVVNDRVSACHVAFWPMMVDNRSQPDVRFRAETNFG
jgi:hypothetical protein